MSPTKRCRTCREELPLDYAHFGRRVKYADGWNPDCRSCAAAHDRARRKPMTPQKAELRNAQRRAARRLEELTSLKALEALWEAAVARQPPADHRYLEVYREALLVALTHGDRYLPDRIAALEKELAEMPEAAVLAAKASRERLAAKADISRVVAAGLQVPPSAKSAPSPSPLLAELDDWELASIPQA